MSSSISSVSKGAGSPLPLLAAFCGLALAFAWLPGSAWSHLLPSLRAIFFLPLLSSAFGAGWLVGLLRLKAGQAEQGGAIRSQASITGFLTALVACFATHAASGSARLSLEVVAMFTGFGLLPCALLATVGAGFAQRVSERSVSALAANAALPAAAVLVWPAVYVAGKFLENPPVVVTHAPAPVVAPPPPKPRYVKPENFDSTNAWRRVISHEDIIPNADAKSPFVLSHDENRLAFVMREGGGHQLVVRHLHDPESDDSLPLDGGIAAMAWSPDGKRIIFLSSKSDAFAVCIPGDGRMIRLPIPKTAAASVAGLAWWRAEDVVLTLRRREPLLLSLDTLRLMPADGVEAWAKLTQAEQADILRSAEAPPLHSGATVRYELGGDRDSRALVIHDAEAHYSRALLPGLQTSVDRAFTSSDGGIVFLAERERLRVLYVGLRDAPTLRFVAEGREDFPVTAAVKVAIKARSIECVIAPPIINPLNGKTVAGDVEHAKGLARVIAAEGKSTTIWVSEEREPVRIGDVVTLPRAPLPGGEALLSPTWFAVLAKADASQDIPRRASAASPTKSESAPADSPPAPAMPQGPPPALPAAPSAGTPVFDQLVAKRPELLARKTEPAPPPTFVSQVPPLPANASAQDKVKHFIALHHAKMCDGDLDGRTADYGAIVSVAGKDMSREQMRQRDATTWAQAARVTERVDGPISVTAQQNNRHRCEYGILFEFERRDGFTESGAALVDMDVLLTSAGPKIVSKRIRIYRSNPTRRK